MKGNLAKKYSVLFILAIYVLAYFLQSFSFFDFGPILNKTYAEDQLDYTNLVAVFVDDKIYDDIEDDIKRYAQKYIQGDNGDNKYNAISNSKAIVLPIDTDNIDALEITKILENMYFDGISGEPSKLAGTVLIGNIPLPVVNQDGVIYPTIYPYVDFEKQKFIWNDKVKYFVYNDNPDGEAEIWHGIINFDKTEQYNDYFDKLRSYSEKPSEFIGKSIWYDDFVANKQYFYSEALNSYINNFLFAEDIGYRRYTDLMVKLMQGNHNDMIADLVKGFDGMDELNATTESMNTPTLSIEKIVKDGYIKSYTSLIGGKQLDNIVRNVEAANRWIEQYTGSDGEQSSRTALDTHYMKMEMKDETLLRMNGGLDPLIITFNDALEDIVNNKIEEEKYWLNEVVPLTYLEYDGYKKLKNCTWKKYNAFENYFFGVKASTISEMKETSTYRGTWRNLDDIVGLSVDDIQSSDYPSSDIGDEIDLNKKSIGGSYDIFATQVDANRGYNIANSIEEYGIYDDSKIAQRDYWNTKCDKVFLGICWRKRRREADTAPEDHLCTPGNEEEQGGCEMPADFAMRNRGGASPLNLSGMDNWTIAYNFQDAIMPIFDIAGSKEVTEKKDAANSFKGIEKYSRLIQKTFVPDKKKYYTKNKDKLEPDLPGQGYNPNMGEDMKFTNWMPGGDLEDPTWTYTNPKLANSVDFFDKFDNSAYIDGSIIKIENESDDKCVGKGTIYTYKTLDSRVKNNLSTNMEIDPTNFKTFQDSQSPVKILYNGIWNNTQRLDKTVQTKIDTLAITTDSGLVYNLNDLGDYIQGIDDDINDIIDYNISSLSNLSSSQIQTLADIWSKSFVAQDRTNIEKKAENAKDQLLDLDGFAKDFSYDYLSNYIDEQLYNFDINKWELIFLDSRKTNILSQLVTTKNKFYSIEGLVSNAEDEYNNISDLSATLSASLWTKRAAINLAVTNSSGQSLGCSSTYADLCGAIDSVRSNLSTYRTNINDKIDEIDEFEFNDITLGGIEIWPKISIKPFDAIEDSISSSNLSSNYTIISSKLGTIPISDDIELESSIPGMNMTTSDRPVDSPKYITFKGIGGDKVTFIYPNIYKSEIFSGNSNILKLKSPEEIAVAIKAYLRATVHKYNDYLLQESNKKDILYNQNPNAYDLLDTYDPLANPRNITNRSYKLMNEDILINQLEEKLNNSVFFAGEMGGYEPIEFIAHMIYYQNIATQQREVGETIEEDMNNIRSSFDVNEKISHIVDNYLIKDNNKGNFITPGYRDEGYEVAFINSDGADYIDYKEDPAFMQRVKNASKNYKKSSIPKTEQSQLEEELQNECNIPEDGGVLLFDIQEGDSPWLKSLRCWWEKIKEKPFKFEFDRSSVQGPPIQIGSEGDSVSDVILDNLGVDDMQKQYMNQLDMMDTDDENQEVLDNSNPGDYQKLNQIVSYTKVEIADPNINADTASGYINISSSIRLGDVEFYVQNLGSSEIAIADSNGTISNNISIGQANYTTGAFALDPFDTKSLYFDITKPIGGINILIFYMCLPGTQNIDNCVKKSVRINVIPGAVNKININTPGNKILEGSKMPITVKGLDKFGNSVGPLISQKFTITTSTGSLSYKSTTNSEIKFSDFDKSNFVLNADEGISDGDEIRLEVNGTIGGVEGTFASKIIQVVKGNLDIYHDDKLIEALNIHLPVANDYSYKDSFDLTQTNLNSVPKLVLKLVDENGDSVNIKSVIKVSSQNGLIKPGNIETRSITKVQGNMTFEVEQNRFRQETNYIIQDGEITIYLMPNFKAGDDTVYISMPGIDDIEIPLTVIPAPASMIEIKTKKDEIATESNTKANLTIMDTWGNIITQDTMIKLGSIGPINISGFDSSSSMINVQGGILDFDINSQNKGGIGFVYAVIDNLALEEQKPGNASITVQEKILPEEDLNVMYLNLFGSDWGNQRGYMSENNKYIQELISKSDKLLATTTQLISPDKLKKFAIVIDQKLHIYNIEDADISLNLDGQLNFDIEEIGDININTDSHNSFEIQEVDVSDENLETVIDTLANNKYKNKNVLLYLPEDTDSIIEANEVNDNAIYINNDNVFDLDNMTSVDQLSVKLSNKTLAGYQVRDAFVNSKKIGRILISVKDEDDINLNIFVSSPLYDYGNVWVNGSTNNRGMGLYEIDSSLSNDTMGYKSIQDSIDPKLSLGFRNDFKNITNFGAGESIGESTLPFSSEFLINIGDPLLKRVSENESAKTYNIDGNLDTDIGFDKGLGEVVYSEPGKTIFKVINIDFNNDGLEDIIVAFTDGTIKILKNYGGNNGNNAFKQLGDLMILSDGIKDIIIGDVDGDNYEDIIIWTKGDELRVYKNNKGVFDVDGYPICLNTNMKDGLISQEPQSIKGIFQIFFEDMDQDGSLDIVTNDKLGYIKIFYGGDDNPWHEDNYVSSDKYKCDKLRYDKQTYDENTQIVYRFGIRVNENVKVLDQSLIHWQGINPNNEVNISAEDLGIDLSMFDADNMNEDNMENIMAEAMNFDTNNAIQQYKGAERYKKANFGTIPVYEENNTEIEKESDVEYVEIGCLTGEDPIKTYKQYEDLNGDVLENGDIVKISVIIKAKNDFVGTFIDRIKGPWKISLLEDGMMEHFWFDTGSISQDTIDNKLKFHRDMANAEYMIDNIKLSAGEEFKFNYWVTYDGDVQTNKIEIKDINGEDYERGANGTTGDILDDYPQDDYPDIKIKPTDGCNKSMFVLFNGDQNKDYDPEYIDLTELLIDYSSENQSSYDNAMSDITNSLLSNMDTGGDPDITSIPGLKDMLESWNTTDILGDTFDIDTMLSQGGIDLSNIANAPGQIIDGLMGDVMDKVDSLMGDMCNGFDLSKFGVGGDGNCGLPVPFNQGFLGPGDYHLFGCFDLPPLTNTLGKGWPVLNIPGNRGPTAAGYLPAPGIFGFPFRGPTDGFLGGPKAGTYPSQFRLYMVPTLTAEIGIAMCFGPYTVGSAIPDPVSSVAGNCIVTSIPLPCKGDGGGPDETNKIPEAFLDLETCSNQNVPCFVGEGESSSSLEMVSSSSNNTNMTAAIPDGSFAGGFINIEKEPITKHGYNTPESGIEIDGVKLMGGADAKNKILGGSAQGLIAKISKDWMDRQINYIFSNLTNFKVDVYWPDFGGIVGGMGNGGLSSALENEKKKDCLDQKGDWNIIDGKGVCTISAEQKCINRGMDRKEKTQTCWKKTNPKQNDDALGKIDSWTQNNLLDRDQVSSISDTAFANPFEEIEAMFEEVPLINLRTENINVKVPMISSEDITAYTHMSRNWIKEQEKILKEWEDLFKAMIGFCGGDTDIKNFKDMKQAVTDLKEKLKTQLEKENKEKEKENKVESISKKIDTIKGLNSKYDLNALGNYEIFESCSGGGYFIRVDTNGNTDRILPYDIYLSYKLGTENELTMFTKGFDLKLNKNGRKIKVSYERNSNTINNDGICLKNTVEKENNQCLDLFLGGQFDITLNNFVNIQASTDGLVNSVRQNIKTLELYKKFPLDLYEWIHVGDRYMSEISSIVNNFLGTLSLWMKTNATRYSQYVDSLILVMTTIQTYQAIIDLSADRSTKCSSCTNDNYDQFTCKLGLLCPDGLLPVLEIPPMKIPSVYIDLSHLNLATDIKLPKFNFVPTSVPLPSLPNLPSPPNFDIGLDIDQGLSMGLDLIGDLKIKLEKIDLSLTLPTIPVIPAPPDLPEIPSFLPSVKMELPLLPPAPKIPKLPNEISTAIDTVETIGKILCIVKGNIGLVGEDSIKAKVEQMTQRSYEVPYWDNLDQTLSERNKKGKSKIPDWLTDTFGFLKSSEFQEVELKGFDIGVDSYVNLQYNFAGFYDFVDAVVGEVNKYSAMPGELMQAGIDESNSWSKETEARMSACVSTPISEACMGEAYTGDIKKYKERTDGATQDLKNMGNDIENGFDGVKEAMQKITEAENKKDALLKQNEQLGSGGNVSQATVEIITSNRDKIKKLDEEIESLNDKYGAMIKAYEIKLTSYGELLEKINKIKNILSDAAGEVLDNINEGIGDIDEGIDDALKFDKIDAWNKKVQTQMDEFDKKQEIEREERKSNINNLYKDISYVDYNTDKYQENINILQESLNNIKTKTDNESFKKEIDKYLKLSNMDNNISPANKNIQNVAKQYTDIVDNFKVNNDSLSQMIGEDYDKFLYAVKQNDVRLVGNDDINISLYSKLFDIDNNTLKTIKQQDNINKKYLDYYSDNIDGYLHALDTHTADELNMDDAQYKNSKTYLNNLQEKTKLAYDTLDGKKLISQSSSNTSNGGVSNGSYTDISSYIDGKVIKTPEGSIDLASDDYVKDFQGRSLMVDINDDEESDLILWDKNNIYVKYRNGNSNYDNIEYIDDYYKYHISSYDELINDSDEGFIKINDIYLKLCDWNQEVKNFVYRGGDFDSIKIGWMNSMSLGDEPAGYLVKMIHRVDLFNDKEIIVSNSNEELFDKKYILALPKGAPLTGTKISVEEGTYRMEDLLSGLIFDVLYYNENEDNINLTIQDIPRNWQYSEIYTLDLYEDSLYSINNSSSNQIVAGPQIIADTKGPTPVINLYRPAVESVIDTGETFEGYVSTNYILQASWEDNVSVDRLWIADEQGNNISVLENINNKTGYIELSGLFFTGATSMNYYFGATDINDNSNVTQVNLKIKIPDIKIVDVKKYGEEVDNIGSPATITAEIDHDLDEGYVQFSRWRNNLWSVITGTMEGIDIDKYDIKPYQTIITGGYYDFNDDVGLYLPSGELAVKINPNNGKINIVDGFEDLVNIGLDYSMKTAMIKISEVDGNILFWIALPSKELISIYAPGLEVQDLVGDVFGDFQGGKAIITDNEVWIYIGPNGEIYTEGTVYGDYSFDEQSDNVIYSFKKTPNGPELGHIELKIQNLLGK